MSYFTYFSYCCDKRFCTKIIEEDGFISSNNLKINPSPREGKAGTEAGNLEVGQHMMNKPVSSVSRSSMVSTSRDLTL